MYECNHPGCPVTCVVCGAKDCGGIGRWACHPGPETDAVCRGPCWRKYEADRSARETEAMWLSAFTRWAMRAEPAPSRRP